MTKFSSVRVRVGRKTYVIGYLSLFYFITLYFREICSIGISHDNENFAYFRYVVHFFLILRARVCVFFPKYMYRDHFSLAKCAGDCVIFYRRFWPLYFNFFCQRMCQAGQGKRRFLRKGTL